MLVYLIHTVEPSLNGHPTGTGKWLLNGGWPLNRGLSRNWQNHKQKRHFIIFETNACGTEQHYWSTSNHHDLLRRTVFSFIIFLK